MLTTYLQEPDFKALARRCTRAFCIRSDLYKKYNVKRGLRDADGTGVRAGLTSISTLNSQTVNNGVVVSNEGELRYRGVDIHELVNGFVSEGRLGFEESAFLLLFGDLPTMSELENFKSLIGQQRILPENFIRNFIMVGPSADIMNNLQRSLLSLACYDEHPNDLELANVLNQSINLISVFPMLAIYSYHAYNNRHGKSDSFYIHRPDPTLSEAEALLTMLRPDKSFTPQEAQVLDMALVLHMEHGGGNNSTFTTRVVTSSGTDTYSAMSAALASLKGPRHGGANIKAISMMNDLRTTVKDVENEEEIRSYLIALLEKKAFDKRGLIYGMGHAVYLHSDPRAQIFKKFVERLAAEKGDEYIKEFELYKRVEKLAPEVISQKKHTAKGISTNIDFFSGFVYKMLGLPEELFTPLFAAARIVGWSAHRLEELVNTQKIIRPAYVEVTPNREYVSIADRISQ